MKILVAGAKGFLGSHVVDELHRIKSPNDVILEPSHAELDLLNKDQTFAYFANVRPNVIINLAALCGGIKANQDRPADFLRDNTQMGLNVYEAARLFGVEYVHSAGSVCAYASECRVPFTEDDMWGQAPHFSNRPYGQAKRTLQMLSETYRTQYGIKGAFLVPVNMFGCRDSFDPINSHVVPALIGKIDDAIHNSSPFIECWGTEDEKGNTASRELMYVNDCAEAFAKCAIDQINYPKPINLGTGKDITIKDLAKLISELMGYNGKIVFNSAVGNGQQIRRLDVNRALQTLQWQAKTTLRDGLVKTIEWYRANKQNIK